MERREDGSAWRDVWRRRDLPPGEGSILARLLEADGYDTGFGNLDEASWSAFVDRRIADLGIVPGMSVYEVGCGAGAFLYEVWRRGCGVGGIDWAERLVELARRVMPDGSFEAREASQLEVQPRADVVVSCGVFYYFPSREYAERVIELMADKATHAIAIFDLPDAALEQEALAFRRAGVGGDAAYAARYAGLDHCYYEREWIVGMLRDHGLGRVNVVDQDMVDYENGRFRFNAWGFKSSPAQP